MHPGKGKKLFRNCVRYALQPAVASFSRYSALPDALHSSMLFRGAGHIPQDFHTGNACIIVDHGFQ